MKSSVTGDEKTLNGIVQSDNAVIVLIYRNIFPSVRKLVLENSGALEDAEDIFQDALVIVYRKLRMEGLVLKCSFKTYFYAICKNLWLQKLQRKKVAYESVVPQEKDLELPFGEDELREMEKYNILQKHLLGLSSDCRDILEMFYNKVPLTEIARKLGLSSADYAKFRKYQCKEMLKRKIMNDPQTKRLFLHE
ncbi:MAG: sigma-70 family RNA polymerase sigma factor [Bacteroidales bacterium]|nr:sigma-70 family RNA polymerase sigma factor [Bacteroidales bacterium]